MKDDVVSDLTRNKIHKAVLREAFLFLFFSFFFFFFWWPFTVEMVFLGQQINLSYHMSVALMGLEKNVISL